MLFNCFVQGGPKVGIGYTVYYYIPTFGPPCMIDQQEFGNKKERKHSDSREANDVAMENIA
jgi:hypothetical protein